QVIANFNSKADWEELCFKSSNGYLKNHHFRKWVNSKKIHIINLSNLGKDKVRCIGQGMKESIKLTGMKFKIIEIQNERLKEYSKLLDSCVHRKELKSSRLVKGAIKKRINGKTECADIFITNYPIESNGTLIQDGEALTFVPKGISIFTFSGKVRYPKSFLRRRAKHEGLHLLGLNIHHEGAKVKGYNNDASCVMRYNAPIKYLCPKCRVAIKSFWKGVKDGI
ncbi:hypothetical protein HYS31_00365, partial [Candidatus Woesearchaeota archaeon]|nr:hypothetical protein [Candidatus Woesearchaeota archaeon]